jgi:hypothetical protein
VGESSGGLALKSLKLYGLCKVNKTCCYFVLLLQHCSSAQEASLAVASEEGYPSSVSDMITIARTLVSRHEETDDMASFFAMVLATSHVADWFTRLAHKLDLSEIEDGWFAGKFPMWDPIRAIGNGLKHAKRIQIDKLSRSNPVPSLDLSWGNRNFWAGEAWATPWDGEWRAVSRLCEIFLDDFERCHATLERPPKRPSNRACPP